MATNELIDKLKEIIVHVGPAGEYKSGYDIVRNLRETKCKECIRLADELDVLESQAKEPSDADIANWADSINNEQFGCPRNRIAHYAAIIGAKAARDGKIKTQTK